MSGVEIKAPTNDDPFVKNKVYSFKPPLPPPSVKDIFSNSEFTNPLPKVVKPPEVIVIKKPKWLVRGDLSEVSSVDDMLQLDDLSEDSILLNLRIRYKANIIYTYIGSILVAINPYRKLPLYGAKQVKQYDGSVLGPSLSPHLFAIGNEAISNLLQRNEDQCVIVSGESGSGKTESIKLLVEYWAKVNASKKSLVSEQLIKATPILESFGNAKTLRNHNSSRFGKYMEISYDKGRILGGKLSQYLLEKSRIIHQQYAERNFHVFYELLSGCSKELKMRLNLSEPHEYNYLSKSYDWKIDGKSDEKDFEKTVAAMNVLEITQREQVRIFEGLAGILHLGNLDFIQNEAGDQLMITNQITLSYLSECLQLDLTSLVSLLTQRHMTIKGERVAVSLSVSQGLATRDAIARALYFQLFTWLVHKINKIINPTIHLNKAIAVLDIFGFENFRSNSFEQLCINYANEQLQFLFTKTVFELEVERYEKEGVNVDDINLKTNEAIVDLFSLKPYGIMPVLDDESQFPKGTDKSFLDKLHKAQSENELYTKPKTDKLEFTVIHYAGPVTYTARQFIEKNKDLLRADVVDLLCSSKNPIIAQVFSDHKESNSTRHLNKITGRITTLKPKTPTISASFQESLTGLMENISRCRLWFVRCIKPNTSKSSMVFDCDLVTKQIKSTGLLDTVKIRSLGYPCHMTCEDFLIRYEYLYKMEADDDCEAEEFCIKVLKEEFEAVSPDDFQMGKTELFLREGLYQHLEQQRLDIVLKSVRVIENMFKTVLLKRRFNRQKRSAIKIQAFWRAYFHRQSFLKFKRNICRLQANLRTRWQKRFFEEHRNELIEERNLRWLDAGARRELTRQEMKNIIGLEVPTDLAFMLNMSEAWSLLHSDKNVMQLSSKIFTQSLGFKLPHDINNYIFTHFSESHFQNHIFIAKREPIHHPFLIKIRENDYKQALALFKLILRFMYDANMPEEQQILIGNYIIQQALRSAALRDEVLVQICVQMWSRSQSDVCRSKISLLMAICLSALTPSQLLYKYLLKFCSDQAFDGYKTICQHKLLRGYSLDFPQLRYYPPTLLEWQACRKKAKMALPIVLPKGNYINCHIDSWTTGEECAKLALCACGLFENRHGWTIQLHDTDGIYEASGNDCVLDLIGEIEVPSGLPYVVAPFLVSMAPNIDGKPRPSHHSTDTPHRADLDRQVIVDVYEPALPPSDFSSSITSIKDNLRIVPKPDQIKPEYSEPSQFVTPKAPPLIAELSSRFQPRNRRPLLRKSHDTKDNDRVTETTPSPQPKTHSRLNERPSAIKLPGLSETSLMNKRYVRTSAQAASDILNEKYAIEKTKEYSSTKIAKSNKEQTEGVKSKKTASVTFNDQRSPKALNSVLNVRWSKPPPNALSTRANLNARYMEKDKAGLTKWANQPTGLTTQLADYPTPLPENDTSLPANESTSIETYKLSVAPEARQNHQDIMGEINRELQTKSNRFVKNDANNDRQTFTGASSRGVIQRRDGEVKQFGSTRSIDQLTGISDLDNWVDMVFDPIIDENTTNGLTTSQGLQKSLKGNGCDAKDEATQWPHYLLGAPSRELSGLQSIDGLLLLIKGEPVNSEPDNNDNNNNNTKTNGMHHDIVDSQPEQKLISDASRSWSPFSYSHAIIPKQLLHSPSLNNLNSPPSPNSTSKRPKSPIDSTSWNMFENVSKATINSSRCSSKITNLAGKLIANVKEVEVNHKSPAQVLNDTSEPVNGQLTPEISKENESPATELATTSVHSSLSGDNESHNDRHNSNELNVVLSKSGQPTTAKAPKQKQPISTVELNDGLSSPKSSISSSSPRNLVPNQRFSPALSVSITEAATIKPQKSLLSVKSMSPIKSPATKTLRWASTPNLYLSDNRPELCLSSVDNKPELCLSSVDNKPELCLSMVDSNLNSKPDSTKLVCQNSLNENNNNGDDESLNQSQILSDSVTQLEPVTVADPVTQLGPAATATIPPIDASKVSAAGHSQLKEESSDSKRSQIYWEQLSPDEPPVKIIIPTPKAQRKKSKATSKWDKLLIALKIIKKPESPQPQKGRWSRLRQLLRNHYTAAGESVSTESLNFYPRIPDTKQEEPKRNDESVENKSVAPEVNQEKAARRAKMGRLLKQYASEQKAQLNNSQHSKMNDLVNGYSSEQQQRQAYSTVVAGPSSTTSSTTSTTRGIKIDTPFTSPDVQENNEENSKSVVNFRKTSNVVSRSKMAKLLLNYASEQKALAEEQEQVYQVNAGEVNSHAQPQLLDTESKKAKLSHFPKKYATRQQTPIVNPKHQTKHEHPQFYKRLQRQHVPFSSDDPTSILKEARLRLSRSSHRVKRLESRDRNEIYTDSNEVDWLVRAKQRLNKSPTRIQVKEMDPPHTPSHKGPIAKVSDNRKVLKRVDSVKRYPKPIRSSNLQNRRAPKPSLHLKSEQNSDHVPTQSSISHSSLEQLDDGNSEEPLSVASRAKLYFKDLIRVNHSKSNPTTKQFDLPSIVFRARASLKPKPEPEPSYNSITSDQPQETMEVTECMATSSYDGVTHESGNNREQDLTSVSVPKTVPFLFKSANILPNRSDTGTTVEKSSGSNELAVQTDNIFPQAGQIFQPSFWGHPIPYLVAPPYFAFPPPTVQDGKSWWPQGFPQMAASSTLQPEPVTKHPIAAPVESQKALDDNQSVNSPQKTTSEGEISAQKPKAALVSSISSSPRKIKLIKFASDHDLSNKFSSKPLSRSSSQSKLQVKLQRSPASSSAQPRATIDLDMESTLPPILNSPTPARSDLHLHSKSAVTPEKSQDVNGQTSLITSSVVERVPSKVGKIVWPPVKEEPPKEVITHHKSPNKTLRSAARDEVGKLAIEEAKSVKPPPFSKVKRPFGQSARPTQLPQQVTGSPSKTLSERMELLEKKIGSPPSPSNPVVEQPLSVALEVASVTEPEGSTPVSSVSSHVSTPDTSVASTPKAVMIDTGTQPDEDIVIVPATSSSLQKQESFTQTSLNRKHLRKASNTSSANSSEVGSQDSQPAVIVDTSDEVYTGEDFVSDRVPTKGAFQLLAAVRTSLHSDKDVMTYLTYSNVPWTLSIRKEVFSPNETLSNPKTIDLIFYQIVRDIFGQPCVRVPEQGRIEMKKLLGDINAKTMMDTSISADVKWKTIKLARQWPFYFSRIFAVMGDGTETQLVGVSHSGVWFGKKEQQFDGKLELIPIKRVLYEDISQLTVPREGVFQMTAEHVIYRVLTPKAGALLNLINAYGIEDMQDGKFVQATSDYITCEPGHISFKKGDIIKLKPEKMSFISSSLPAPSPGWLYGSFNGRVGSFPEESVKHISKKDISRNGSFSDTRSRHSSGRSDGEISPTVTGKYSMLEFSMMYFRENLDRYISKSGDPGIQNNIKVIENLKLSAIKRKKSIKSSSKDAATTFAQLIAEKANTRYLDKLQRQESWSWKEQADMIKWTKTPIPASLLKLPTEQMNKVAVDCFLAVMQFMGDKPLEARQTDIDCAFKVLKACHQCPELRDEIYCQLSRQTTNNKSPNSQSCLRGWRLYTLVACWFSPSEILKPYLLNYLQQNASDPSRPYHTPAQNCLQMLRKTIKYGGRRNVPSAEEIIAITDGKLNRRQQILLPGGISVALNVSPSTVVQDIIYDMCAKIGVVSQMEQDEYTVFAVVEKDNEFARLKREEYVMDVVTELRLQRKDCVLMFERTSWYFPIRLDTASYEHIEMMFSQCVPDYIDGYLITLDQRNPMPARQLDDIITLAALLYRAAGNEEEPESVRDIENLLPGQLLSLGILRHAQFVHGVQTKLQRLVNYSDADCKIEFINMLKRWPLFGASFFRIQCSTEPKLNGDCLLAINRAGVHFLHHKTHRVILSYPFTEVISSRKISHEHKGDEQYLDIKVGNNKVQKVLRIETTNGSDIAYLIGQYIKAVNSSVKLSA